MDKPFWAKCAEGEHMIARLREAARNDDGASAVEFAFIGTLLVLPLVFGAISFGMVFAGDLATSNAARQGARLGTVVGADSTDPNNCADIVTEVKSAVPSLGLASNNITIGVQLTEPSGSPTTICATNAAGGYTTGSGTVVPCQDADTDSQVTVYARSTTTMFFIPPYYFKSNGYPVEGKGVYRCEFN
jgi:Flp pilus assembly protein TadG